VTPPPEVVCTALAKTFDGGTEAVRPDRPDLRGGADDGARRPVGLRKVDASADGGGAGTPSAGTIEIGGAPPAATLRRAGLSVAFQDPSLLPWRSVRGNIELALNLARRRPDREIDQLIALVGLDGFADTRPAELSGGMRQRAAIARALATSRGFCCSMSRFGAVDELTRRSWRRICRASGRRGAPRRSWSPIP
jgi:NitT/TauT family transport system ATP-binding protein